MFWYNLSVPSSRFKNPIGCPETLERNYHYSLHNNPEQHSSQCGKMYYELTTLPCILKKQLGLYLNWRKSIPNKFMPYEKQSGRPKKRAYVVSVLV